VLGSVDIGILLHLLSMLIAAASASLQSEIDKRNEMSSAFEDSGLC
jgi:hypothetical protein